MPATDLLKGYSLSDLCSHCREEILRFRRGEAFDDAFCFEIFRRAVVEHEEECWRELHDIYHDQILAWCRRASRGSDINAEDLVGFAWEKFWHSFGPENFARADGTAAVQRYLKMCAQTAAIDVARDRQANISLDRPLSDLEGDGTSLRDLIVDPAPTPEQALTAETAQAEFWRLVGGLTNNDAERAIVYMKYEIGLKSGEIQAKRPDLFPEIGDVYRTTRNLLDRLRRSPELSKWLGDESS
jgi:hypothetical protein